jgi:hypothetical protein
MPAEAAAEAAVVVAVAPEARVLEVPAAEATLRE